MRYSSSPFRSNNDDLSSNIRCRFSFFPHPERLGGRVENFSMWTKEQLCLRGQETSGGIKMSSVSENENIDSKMLGQGKDRDIFRISKRVGVQCTNF